MFGPNNVLAWATFLPVAGAVLIVLLGQKTRQPAAGIVGVEAVSQIVAIFCHATSSGPPEPRAKS